MFKQVLACLNLPELDVEQRSVREVGQTLDVEDLLDLGSSFYQRLHWFGLNVKLWLVVKDHRLIIHTLTLQCLQLTAAHSANTGIYKLFMTIHRQTATRISMITQ